MKRKGNVGIAAVVIVAAILLALALFNISWPVPGAIEIGGCPLISPEFGRMECEPVSNVPITLSQQGFGAEDYGDRALYRVKCGDDENTPQCDFIASCNGGVDAEFFFQIDNLDTDPQYNCPIGSDRWCHPTLSANTPTKVAEGYISTVLQIGACRKLGLFYYPGQVSTKFIPYGLNVYDSGGKYRYNTNSCALDGFTDAHGIMKNCGTNVEDCEKAASTSTLAFDDWVNYLIDWDYVVEGVNSKVVLYNNQQAYCQVDTIYNIETITTKTNQCYKVPTTIIDKVECCPGMQGPNRECGDDFKWHDLGTQTGCFSDIECYGQGNYVPDYGTSEQDVVKWGCVNKQCIVLDRKIVECTPPNIGCPPGYICNPNNGYVCETQTGPSITCGDGVCSSPYEDVYNCPTDCGQPGQFDWNILWIIVFAALLGLVGWKLGGAVAGAIGAIVGGLIGYVIYWFFGLAWWQQTLLAIGGIAAGGILVYLLIGLIAIAVPLIIYAYIKG